MSGEESSPLEGTDRFDPERSLRTKIIVLFAALVLIIAAYSYVGTRDRSLDIEHRALISQQQEDGLICCIQTLTHGDESYLIMLTRELESEFRTVVLRVMELQDDGTPREINAIGSPFPSQVPISFAVIDRTAYIPVYGEDEAGVWIADLSDPERPETLGFAETGSGVSRHLAGEDGLLVVNHTDELAIVDLTSDSGPERRATIDREPSGSLGMTLNDGLLYVNDTALDVFHVYDLREPGSPESLATVPNPDGPGEFRVEFGVMDAADRLDASVMPDKYLDFAVDGDRIYVAASNLGVRVLEWPEQGDPAVIDEFDLPGRAVRVSVSAGRLFVLGATAATTDEISYSIHTVDISDPERPELVDTIEEIVAEPGLQVLLVSEDRAFLGVNDTLLVFDIR